MRVLQWIVERVEGKAQGVEHAFGISPRYEDLDWTGLDFSRSRFEPVIDVDPAEWKAELALHDVLFKQLAYHLPAEIGATKANIEARLDA